MKRRICLFSAVLLVQGLSHAVPRVTVEDLNPSSGFGGEAYDINNLGHVVGRHRGHAFFWDPVSGMQDLGVLPGFSSSNAMALNDHDQVAGDSSSRAFLWDSASGMQDLGTLGGNNSVALDINNSGQVVGWSMESGSFKKQAFLWDSGTMTKLQPFHPNVDTEAYSINDQGLIVGRSRFTGVVWDSGTPQSLLFGIGEAVNNTGQIVGRLGGNLLFWPSKNATPQTIAQGGPISKLGINDSGQVVGQATPPNTNTAFPFLWTGPGGSVHDLNSIAPAGWTIQSANAINNYAQIVGQARHVGVTRAHPYRMTLHPDWQGGSGSWGDPTHWNYAGLGSLGFAPGFPHDVLIASNTAIQVTASSGNVQIDHLKVVGDSATGNYVTFDLNGGTITASDDPGFDIEFIDTRLTGSGTLNGDVYIDPSIVSLDIWGNTPGSYDHMVFNGVVSLVDTILQVNFTQSWSGSAGDVYDLFDWNGGLTGTFANLVLPTLTAGLSWDVSALYSTGELKITGASAPAPAGGSVPEPAPMLLMGIGFLALALELRRSLTSEPTKRNG